MKNKIITISREFGSGGRTIGKKVAEELGIACYDRELLQKIAEESGFSEKYVQDVGEYAPGGFLASAFSHWNSGPNNADYLWEIQYRTIVELAEKGPCVIVGRCADYIFGTKQIAFGCLSMQAWIFGQSVLSKNMENVRYLPNSVYETKIDGGRPIIDFIPI